MKLSEIKKGDRLMARMDGDPPQPVTVTLVQRSGEMFPVRAVDADGFTCWYDPEELSRP